MTAALWRLEDALAATGGVADGAAGRPITGFSIDTRSLVPGDVFVALEDQRDGHAFVPAAFARGAAAALVRSGYVREPGDGLLIRVDDPLAALGRIGVAARARLGPTARVVAVTGSAGKTGTKEMLRAAFSAVASAPARVHAPEKSYNNHWGVPLTLARMPADTESAVFEIGMNHAGEIRPLVRMVRPQVAIVTNVLPVHVGNFADGEVGVAHAKSEIFEGLEPGGVALILAGSPHEALLSAKAKAQGATVMTFGASGADLELIGTSADGSAASAAQDVTARFRATGERITFRLGMAGSHLATNALAVLLAMRALGLDVARAASSLASVTATDGRGRRAILSTPAGELLLIDESYNANPASMQAALAGLAAVPRARHVRRVAILGDMLELGVHTERYHRDLLPHTESADLVLCCGPAMRLLHALLPAGRQGAWAATSGDLVPHVLDALRPGDAVMVKGSLGSRMAPIVEAIRKRFAPGHEGR